MDVNDVRALTTLIVFLAFVGIAVWAYSRSNKETLDEHARIPFDSEETHS